jgi:hypothetical protein
MFEVKCDIQGDLESKFSAALSDERLIARTLKIAAEAGTILLSSAVQNCIDSVYGASSETTDIEHEYDRTLALLESHIVTDEGLTQFVGIDPSAEAVDPHSGREMVLDYAIPVHEGYTQFFMGKNTGNFVAGKFWFDAALGESTPVLVAFVDQAFTQIIEETIAEIFG